MRRSLFSKRLSAVGFTTLGGLLLAGCEESGLSPVSARSTAPIPPQALAAMDQMGSSKSAPVLIRAYKKEAELEIWKMKADGRYAFFKSYPMCRWSGQLGPKVREGDRQVPEGFYAVTPAHMNPNSAYYLSFDVGYPNTYDRAWGRTGGSIMVHGICSSAGCFSMTDGQIAEIYAVVREAFAGGQRAIQMQSYPFHMTAENLAKYRLDPNIDFWKQLKEGYDNFEVTKQDVAVGVCNRHYVFNAVAADGSHLDPTGACPPLKHNDDVQADVAQREKRDDAKIADLAAGGLKPIHTVYTDGGQHPDFASLASYASRPDALASGPIDVALNEDKPNKPKKAHSEVSAKASAGKTDESKPAQAATSTQAETKPSDAVTAAAASEAEKTPPSWLRRLWGGRTSPEEKAAVAPPDAAATAPVAASPAGATQQAQAPAQAAQQAQAPAQAARKGASTTTKPRDGNNNGKPQDGKPQDSVAAPAPVKPAAALSPGERAKLAMLRGAESEPVQTDRSDSPH